MGEAGRPEGTDTATAADLPFEDAQDAPGLKPLPDDLRPELREFVLVLRRLFKATGKTLRQFAVYHHISPASVSRYLAAGRIPEKSFLDALLKSACHAYSQQLTPDMQSYVYRLHREALLSEQPGRYRMQLASDRLEQAVLEKEQAELQIRELQLSVSDQKHRLRDLEQRIQDMDKAGAQERERLGAEVELFREQRDELVTRCEQLSLEIVRLEERLEQAQRDRDDAHKRCQELEAQLTGVQEDLEREELERRARQEQLRLAQTAGIADRHLDELTRVHEEAEQVRLAAARDAAALHHLRDMAQDVARRHLPELVEKLSVVDPQDIDTSVQSVGIHERDEINQVARAFDEVHREAVRLAAEQALLRGSVKAMFVNLSRRNQGLIQRQMALLADLEHKETDPDQLASLFKLDHLATRMRRHGENLFVLAGEKPGRRWTRPVPLVDVLRAAASEVEQYERIALTNAPSTDVAGRIVLDLVHLLAELLENATSFSPPHTKVRVTAAALPDGRALVEIHDAGVGLSREDLAAINERLASPPTVDYSTARRMGIFVVGRLSVRHGIRSQLRSSGSGGTTALVMLPADTVSSALTSQTRRG
jgi:signal transduction histidine kinase